MRSIIPIIPQEIKDLLPFGFQVANGSYKNPYWPTLDDVLKTLSSPLCFPFSVYQQSTTSIRIVSQPPTHTGDTTLLAFAAPGGKRVKVERVNDFRWVDTADIVRYEHNGTWYYDEVTAADGTVIHLEPSRIVRVRVVTATNDYLGRLYITHTLGGEIIKTAAGQLTGKVVEPMFELPVGQPERYHRVMKLLALYPVGKWELLTGSERKERERTVIKRVQEWRKKLD